MTPTKQEGEPLKPLDANPEVEARMLVAQAWCTPENAHKVMDPDLAFAVADIFAPYIRALRASPPGLVWPREWPDDVLYTGKEIRPFAGLLAMFQTDHDEKNGGDCGCKLCKKYGRLNFSLFLPPTDNPEIRAMEDARRARELGLPIPPTSTGEMR